MGDAQFIAKGANLGIRRVAGNIGAEIADVQLTADISADLVEALKQALWRHKVLFFRSHGHIDDVMHERIALLFGDIHDHPTTPNKPGTHISELDSRRKEFANFWHTDQTFQDAPPSAAFLRAVTVPDFGGDTMWANAASAYAVLPDQLRELADRLRAVHTNARWDVEYEAGLMAMKNPFTATIYETEHPVVRVHPETGERSLMLGNYAQKFVGYSGEDSQHLFRVFMNEITRPENVVRWRWREGDFVIWDERATLHYAIRDYGDQRRVIRRITVCGEVPVGVDGRPSELRYKVRNPLQPLE